MSTITADLNSWIIQDGNYDDFHCGDRRKLAIEFCGKRLTPSNDQARRYSRNHGAIYTVTAQVAFVHPKVWVIDFGVLAYWESPPPDFANVGAWVEGEILIGVDPFFYKEYLYQLLKMPDLFNEWVVSRVELNTTPWIQTTESGRKVFARDPAAEAWAEVEATDAWNDDQGRASYLLHLEK